MNFNGWRLNYFVCSKRRKVLWNHGQRSMQKSILRNWGKQWKELVSRLLFLVVVQWVKEVQSRNFIARAEREVILEGTQRPVVYLGFWSRTCWLNPRGVTKSRSYPITARESGDCFKFPQRDLEQSPSHLRFLCKIRKSFKCWINNKYFLTIFWL